MSPGESRWLQSSSYFRGQRFSFLRRPLGWLYCSHPERGDSTPPGRSPAGPPRGWEVTRPAEVARPGPQTQLDQTVALAPPPLPALSSPRSLQCFPHGAATARRPQALTEQSEGDGPWDLLNKLRKWNRALALRGQRADRPAADGGPPRRGGRLRGYSAALRPGRGLEMACHLICGPPVPQPPCAGQEPGRYTVSMWTHGHVEIWSSAARWEYGVSHIQILNFLVAILKRTAKIKFSNSCSLIQ